MMTHDKTYILCKVDTKKINIPFPFGKSIEISIKIEERVLRCAGTCFIKNSTVKYSRDMNSGYVIITEYFKTLKIFCQIDTRKIFLLSSSPVPHFSLPTKIRTTNLGIHRVFTTQIWATSECTQIVSQYVGWAELQQTKLEASFSRVSTKWNLLRSPHILWYVGWLILCILMRVSKILVVCWQ